MKLDQITLDNFRQYLGLQATLQFSRSKEKNVTLIYGVNGAGKSNLFKALNWCLYGSKVLEAETKKSGVINKEALQRAAIGAECSASVTVSFFHEGEKYVLKRSITCVKESADTEMYREDEFEMMRIHAAGHSSFEPNPIGILNSILAENVRTYFLFDGEKISNFSKPESAEDVKNAIYNVLKLEILERGKEHLQSIANEYLKELRQVAGVQLQDILKKFDAEQTNKDGILNRTKINNEQIELANKRIKEIDAKLEGLRESHKLQKERERLEFEKKQKAETLKAQTDTIQVVASGVLSNINTKIVAKALELLESKRVKGEIPSKIREQFLDDILEKMKCICGRDFTDTSEAYEHLNALRKTSVSGALEEEVITLNANLHGIKSETVARGEIYDAAIAARINLKQDIDSIETEISEISQKLKGSRSEDVERMEKQRETYLSDISDYTFQSYKLQQDLAAVDKLLKELALDIKNAEKNKELETLLTNKMTIARKGADTIDAIYQQFADKMRLRIESRTKDILDQLLWKQKQFTDIQLDKEYNLQIIDRWNRPASPDLSAGERQILSLAFIVAMSQESGSEAPLVIDTPFGRLSKDHRENIVKNIPQLAEQLILFVTEEEMTGQMEEYLKPRVGDRYYLNFNEEIGCTTITQE